MKTLAALLMMTSVALTADTAPNPLEFKLSGNQPLTWANATVGGAVVVLQSQNGRCGFYVSGRAVDGACENIGDFVRVTPKGHRLICKATPSAPGCAPAKDQTSMAGAQEALDKPYDANGKPFAVQPGTHPKVLYDQTCGASDANMAECLRKLYQQSVPSTINGSIPPQCRNPFSGTQHDCGPEDCTIVDCLKRQLLAQQSYTLVLRNRQGVMMLIRGIVGNGCAVMVAYLRVSPDIDNAECFK